MKKINYKLIKECILHSKYIMWGVYIKDLPKVQWCEYFYENIIPPVRADIEFDSGKFARLVPFPNTVFYNFNWNKKHKQLFNKKLKK